MRPPLKLGGWAERWDSREPSTTASIPVPKPGYCTGSRESQRSAHPPSLRGGRIYIVYESVTFSSRFFFFNLTEPGNSKSVTFSSRFFSST